MSKNAEDNVAEILKFRVTPVGNRKIEFLHLYGQGDESMLRVTATRPATQQEQVMWDYIIRLYKDWDADVKKKVEGIDANSVRDSLGTPKES